MHTIQLLFGGVSQGCIYGLIALGFVLIYKATETVNFAQGELMMVGAFAGLAGAAWLGLPWWGALAGAVAATALLGMGLERLCIRPVAGQPTFVVVMVTLGIGYVARGLVTMIPGVGTETHGIPSPFAGRLLRVGGLVLGVEHAVVIASTALLCLLLYAVFRFTRIGVAMQACSQNQLAAWYVGIPVTRLNTLVWGLSAAVAALAGVLLAPFTFVHANMGFIGLKAFPAAVLGGFGSLPGAVIGGITLGAVEALAGFHLPEGYKDVAAWLVVLLVLLLRPSGLFGENLRKKV
jgi:branched-chain amino acid transport system permease protein